MKVYLDNDSLVIVKDGVKSYYTKGQGLALVHDEVKNLVSMPPALEPYGIDSYQRENGSKYTTFADLSKDIGAFFTTFATAGSSGGGTVDPDVTDRLNNLESEVNRLAQHPSMSDDKLFSYSGGTPPATLPEGKNAYYITIHSMSSPQDITLPANAVTGTVVSIDNQQGSDSPGLTFGNEAGGTIDGVHVDTEDILDSSLVFLVKTDTGWVTGFSGLIPKSLDAITAAIKLKLTGSLHTIADIEAALRDRLHTFAEIRNEGFLESVKVGKTGGTVYEAKQLEITAPLDVTFTPSTKVAKIDSSAAFSALIKEYGADGRVRFDEGTKHFYFEVKQPNGTWLNKAEIGGSLIIDTVKYIKSDAKPVVANDELGFYTKLDTVPDHYQSGSTHQALRPYFVLESGAEVFIPGVWEDELRIPQKSGDNEYAAFKSEITPTKIVEAVTTALGNEDWKKGSSGGGTVIHPEFDAYYGFSKASSLDEAGVKGLTHERRTTTEFKFTATQTNEPNYFYFAVPTSHASEVQKVVQEPSSIGTAWNSDIVSVDGVSMTVFRSPHQMYDASVTFKTEN